MGASTTRCPPPLQPTATIALAGFIGCGWNNIYGFGFDLPDIRPAGNGYAFYWPMGPVGKKFLYIGYNGCDDKPVKISYVLYCV